MERQMITFNYYFFLSLNDFALHSYVRHGVLDLLLAYCYKSNYCVLKEVSEPQKTEHKDHINKVHRQPTEAEVFGPDPEKKNCRIRIGTWNVLKAGSRTGAWRAQSSTWLRSNNTVSPRAFSSCLGHLQREKEKALIFSLLLCYTFVNKQHHMCPNDWLWQTELKLN